MLSFMRAHATGWLIKVLLGAIVVVFIFWGAGSFNSKNKNNVGAVNGKPITIEEYNDVYNRIAADISRRLGKEADKKTLKAFNVEKKSFLYLVDKIILSEEAKKLNIKVTDQELADVIRNDKTFHDEKGSFDEQIYNRVLSASRINAEKYEFSIQEDMVIQKLITFVIGNAKAGEEEAREWYNWQNPSVNIQYLVFDPLSYENISVAEQEIKNYFKEHADDYKTPEQVKIEYCSFNISDYQKKINISEQEIKKYYETNIEKYKSPKKVEARHILLKLDKDANEQKVEARKQEAYDIIRKAENGEDFAELAAKRSEGPSAANGGYISPFTKEMMVKPFSDAAFALQEQEISRPVKTVFGWHIIKAEKIHNEKITSFNDAKKDIELQLKAGKATAMAFDDAEKIHSSLTLQSDWTEVAKGKQLAVVKTGFFTFDSPDKNIAGKEAVIGASFALQDMETSDIIESKNEYIIIRVIDRILPEMPTLAKVQDKIKEDLKIIIQRDKAKKDAQNALKDLSKDATFNDVAKKYKIGSNITGFFKKTEPIKGVEYDSPELSKAAFQISSEKPYKIVSGRKGWYLIAFIDKKAPAKGGFEKDKQKTLKIIKEIKREELYIKWLAELRNKAKILTEKNFNDTGE